MTVLSSPNRWWQNWSKTHAYVAQKAFFPTSVGEIAEAIQAAETDHRSVRAVGGGWSFSDASLPGAVTTNRPNVYAVDAIAGAASLAATFPTDLTQPSIASVMSAPLVDLPGSLVMFNETLSPPAVDPRWIYLGNGTGRWLLNGQVVGGVARPDFLNWLGAGGVRPIRPPTGGKPVDETDLSGTLVMHDLAHNPMKPSRDWFYNGHGRWSIGVNGDHKPPAEGTFQTLSGDGWLTPPGVVWSPRASNPSDSLMLLLAKAPNGMASPEPAYLIDTHALASSLQVQLPYLLTASATDAMNATGGHSPRFFFHVEAGITISELGDLLAHQSPRLSLQAISGSPGATLAGALSTATHGAEFNWPLLVDRVMAVHLVGPGGLQWWIEGTEQIADPDKLLAAYPGLARERIISGTTPRFGIPPQDWLKAVVVSMGSIGVLYSVVLEVVPRFGVHEVVVQRTWKTLGFLGNQFPASNLPALLRDPMTAATVSSRIVKLMQSGNLNGTGIVQSDGEREVNQYADLAINPNARPDGDFDTWVGNRELTAALPIDPQPAASNEMGEMIKGIQGALSAPDLDPTWSGIYGFGSPSDVPWNLLGSAITRSGVFAGGSTGLGAKVDRLINAADMIDVGLDTFLTPMGAQAPGFDLAQHVLSGLLAGLLGTANKDKKADKRGVSVGALGFPGSGVMGAALEIALAPADAFGFIQTQILDKVDRMKPFLGYVSIRLCSPTETLLGMPQFSDAAHNCSVMIEVVGFGNDDGRKFITDLEMRTVDLIRLSGLEAMLHWGLENEQFTRFHLHGLMALQRPAGSGMNKLDTFKAVRALIRAESPTPSTVFNNNFTARLGLDAEVADQPYDFGRFSLHGAPRTVHFHFPNDGPGPVRMVPPTVDGDFGPNNLTIVPGVSLANPGQEITVDVTFTPNEPAPHRGTLTILTSVPGVPNGVKVIRLFLKAVVEVLEMVVRNPLPPAVLDLGSVPVGEYRTAELEIHSNSTMDATLDSFSLSAPGADTQVWVETGPISAGQTRNYLLTYQPDRVGALTTNLTLQFTDRLWPPQRTQDVIIPIRAIGTGVQAALSPATLEFGTVVVGESSAPQPVQLTNVGQQPLVVTGLLLGYDFRLVSPQPTTLAPGQSEQLDIAFRPAGDGSRSSDLSITSNSAQPPVPVALHGEGLVQALLHASPPALSFDRTPVGSRGGEQQVTVRNDGVIPVDVQAIIVRGADAAAFRITSISRQLPVPLTPEMSIDVSLVFVPAHTGRCEATLDVDHDGPTSPLQIPLAGRGVAARGLVADTTEVNFGALAIMSSSKPTQVTITNMDAMPAEIGGISIVGPDASDFAIVGRQAFPIRVDALATVTVGVRAKPTFMGPRQGTLSVKASVPATDVALRAVGLGVSAEWSAALLDFGPWVVTSTSQRQEATIQNTGNAPLVVALVDTVGDFEVRDLVPGVMSIAPGQWKYLWIWFKPTAIGQRDGAVQVHVDGGDILSLPLTGVGV
jgi:HYDIN/CFA65/VesB family protein/centrosomal CEP192-like protein